jgi:hypothetical protein
MCTEELEELAVDRYKSLFVHKQRVNDDGPDDALV